MKFIQKRRKFSQQKTLSYSDVHIQADESFLSVAQVERARRLLNQSICLTRSLSYLFGEEENCLL